MVNPYVSMIFEKMSLPKAERHSGLLTISSQNSTEDNKMLVYPPSVYKKTATTTTISIKS